MADPVNTVLPVVTGAATLGSVLNCTSGSWDIPASYAYQWQRETAPASGSYASISAATSPAYTIVSADVALRLRCQVTATGTAALLWSPPTLVNPIDVFVTQNNRVFGEYPPTQDVRVHMPATAISSDNAVGLTLWGGRNWVVIGGEINNNLPDITNNGTAVSGNHYGVYIVRVFGTVHLEGMWVHGAGLGQAIIVQEDTNPPTGAQTTVQVQNCRLEPLNPVHSNGIHTDAIQLIGGPVHLKLYRDTIVSAGNCLQMQPTNHGPGWPYYNTHVGPYDFRAQDWIAQQPDSDTSPQSYGLWKDVYGSQSFKFDTNQADVYYHNNTNHIKAASPNYSCWADGDSTNSPRSPAGGLLGWNPGDTAPLAARYFVSGEAINLGLRPGGVLVPTPGNGGNVGTGYVSPGYQ